MEKEKSKLLRVTNDYVFKRIFGKKENEDITREFLEAVTNEKYEKIDLERNTILERDIIENKMGILDVRVVANKVNDIDIEIQVVKSDCIPERILWYWSKMYSESIERGQNYDKTKKAICIVITDFEVERLKDMIKGHTKWEIREESERNKVLTDRLELHIIELRKAEKERENEALRQWCKFIKAPESVEEKEMEENKGIRRAKEELEKISQDERERRIAFLRDKAIRDEEMYKSTGYKEGIQKGIEKGIAQGKKEGLAEGKKEKQREIIQKMLKENIDLETISKVTGVSMDELKSDY